MNIHQKKKKKKRAAKCMGQMLTDLKEKEKYVIIWKTSILFFENLLEQLDRKSARMCKNSTTIKKKIQLIYTEYLFISIENSSEEENTHIHSSSL